MRRRSAWPIAALALLPATAGHAIRLPMPPVVVHIADGPDNQCLVTADGQPIAIKQPPPPAIRQQMLSRGVRLTYAVPRPDFHCISNVVFPLQREGIDVRN